MKIVVLNGSPKGETSVTMQYVKYLQKQFGQHEFNMIHVAQGIGRIEKDAERFDGIVAAVKLGLSNGLIESLNAKIRLINARGYGHHSAESLAAMIYLCAGGIRVQLPTRR